MTKKKVTAQREIELRLTLEETNTILEALGQLPFMRVYRIIEKIHVQASKDNQDGLTKTK